MAELNTLHCCSQCFFFFFFWNEEGDLSLSPPDTRSRSYSATISPPCFEIGFGRAKTRSDCTTLAARRAIIAFRAATEWRQRDTRKTTRNDRCARWRKPILVASRRGPYTCPTRSDARPQASESRRLRRHGARPPIHRRSPARPAEREPRPESALRINKQIAQWRWARRAMTSVTVSAGILENCCVARADSTRSRLLRAVLGQKCAGPYRSSGKGLKGGG